MADENEDLRQQILEGRTAVSDLGSAIIEYLATVERVTESASVASSKYQDLIGLADVPLSEELGGKAARVGRTVRARFDCDGDDVLANHAHDAGGLRETRGPNEIT